MTLAMLEDIFYLFGGEQPWNSSLWVTSDDRVRRGASQSFLTVLNPERARFHGHLDTRTLGGAGFASQHSLAQTWDLHDYEGIVVAIAGPTKADGKRYALTLKDELGAPRGDGREEASVSWEAEFVAEKPGDVKLPWSAFRATYRGRPKEDAKPLNKSGIKQVGLMMRSFFGKQEGDFSLELHAIAAWRPVPNSTATTVREEGSAENEKREAEAAWRVREAELEEFPRRPARQRRSLWRRLTCGLL